MPNLLAMLGAVNENPTKYTALYVEQFFSGYWPNGNPLRDRATPFLYQKFYSASRNEGILDGLNTEITVRMTLGRRFGNLVYNSNTFPAITGFANFKPFQANVGEQIFVVADTATTVYNATAGQKTAWWTKAATAGRTRFKSVENTLFSGDGVNNYKWSWFPAWTAATSYPLGTCILDGSNNIQYSVGPAVSITSTSVTSNVVTINYTGSTPIKVGDIVTPYGLTTKTSLNYASLSVLSVSAGSFTASYTTSNYSTTGDTGIVANTTEGTPTSGSNIPSFSGTIGTALLDNLVGWVSFGTTHQNMGIAAPTVAPTVQTVNVPAANQWAASTYYWPNALIVDSNNSTGPWIWNLTTAGTTNGSVPSGLTSGTPTPQYSSGTISATPTTVTDGTAVWTCNSLAARATSTAYSLNQVILVSWTYVYYTYQYNNENQDFGGGRFNVPSQQTVTKIPHDVPVSAFFMCTVAGTTSSTATASLPWAVGFNGTTTDGTVTWQNVGYPVGRTSSSTVAPQLVISSSGTTNGNVGNTQLVATATSISDTNSLGETVIFAGVSGGSHPTWAKTSGATTLDNSGSYDATLTWQNTGPQGSANTGNWWYAFSHVNLATGDESTASPLSNPVLLPAGQGVLITGPCSTDTQVNAVKIYRSTQSANATVTQPSLMGLLTTVPAPAGTGTWQFTDTTPDPPNVGSILNILITPAGYATVNGIVSNFNDPPPTGLTNLEFNVGRLWGSVGNLAYYSTGPDVTVGNGSTSWDAANFFEFPGTIMRFWPTTVGMYIFTTDGTWIVTGLGTQSSPFSEPQLVDAATSIPEYENLTFNAGSALCYTTDRQFVAIDATNGASDLGEPIGNVLFNNYPPTSVYVASYRNGYDERGFITNPATNTWLNVMQAPNPETGFIWSPPATLTNSGGVQAVQSIETSPGVFSLLIGPDSTGPILARDSSGNTWTDGGTVYDAFAVFGNLVFAHPGQMAVIAFMTVQAVRAAGSSAPTVGVVFDEIYGKSNTPPFAYLGAGSPEPPKLPASSTLYSLRYYMLNSQLPIWCQHLFWKIDFGSNASADELLAVGFYGKWVAERTGAGA